MPMVRIENGNEPKWRDAGMPPDVNEYDDTLMKAAEALAQRWHQADPDRTGALPDPVLGSDVAGWSPDTLSAFASKLAQLTADQPLTWTSTRSIGTTYKLDSMRNPEVWLLLLPCVINTVVGTAFGCQGHDQPHAMRGHETFRIAPHFCMAVAGADRMVEGVHRSRG